MAFSTYEAFVVVDPVTGRPVRAAAGKVTNPDTGAAVDLFDMNDVPISILTTNAQGYCVGFKTDAAYPSVLVVFGGVTLRKVSLELTLAAESAAASAKVSASQATTVAGDLTDRIEGVEALAGLSPSSPVDGQTADLILQPGTLTRGAVIGEISQMVDGSDAVQPFLSVIENGVRDANLMLIADSTSNETWEWAYLFFIDLAARYPDRTFEYRLWDDDSQGYLAPVSVGTGTRKVTFWNASIAGATSQSWQGARITPAIYDVPADVVMISIGHNEGSGTTYPWAWRARYLSLTESIKAKKPTSTILLIGQNPATANNWQAQRIEVYKEIAARQGYGFVDVHAAFVAAGGDLTIDGIHPNPTGARLWADVMLAAFQRTKAAPRPQQPSMLLRRTVENKMPNATFTDWSGSLPTGWTLANATTAKETTGMETGAAALTVTSTAVNGAIYYNLNAAQVAGKTYTLAVRAKVPAGALGRPGRIGFYDNLGGSKLQATGSDPTDGYRWILHEGTFTAGATTARVYIYAGDHGSSVTVDRIILVEGIEPTDAAELAVASSGGGGGGISETGWSTPAGLTLVSGVTADTLLIKRVGPMVFCRITNLVLPASFTPGTVINVPAGYQSTSGPSGAVSAGWSQLFGTGNNNPRYLQYMAISGGGLRWQSSYDTTTNTAAVQPTRVDGVLQWYSDDPFPA